MITPSGAVAEYNIPTAHSYPWGITAGPDGNVWFTETVGKIGKITASGAITEYPAPAGAGDICKGPDGNLWFASGHNGNKIGRISSSGRVSEYTVSTTDCGPIGITAGPDGNVWFTERDGNKIGRMKISTRH